MVLQYAPVYVTTRAICVGTMRLREKISDIGRSESRRIDKKRLLLRRSVHVYVDFRTVDAHLLIDGNTQTPP